MFTTSAQSGARTAAIVVAVACVALLTFSICSASALASSDEVPTASSALAVSDAPGITEAVGAVTIGLGKTAAASCEGQTFTQPFEAFGDSNYYTLVSGSQFAGPEEEWTLTGGAKIVAGSHPDGSVGGMLQLPKGAQAVSPPTCVTLMYPTARMWLAGYRGVVKTQVVYSTMKSVAIVEDRRETPDGRLLEPLGNV